MDDILRKLLTKAYKNGASDVHLSAGKYPMFRIKGTLTPQKIGTLKAADTERMARSLMSEDDWTDFENTREADLSARIEGLARFRVNVFYQRQSVSIVFRIVAGSVPTLEDLNMPQVIHDITQEQKGMVLVTGPTGSGKSSTLAAMIDYINEHYNRHVITLEDPIEYIHESKNSLIVQREIGDDSLSFLNGLRASLRQDPDVILVGELRDLETVSTAVTAAETGHLVFSTLHTSSAVGTIERIIDMFPPGQQGQIQSQLGSTLKAVIAQTLLKTKDGKGRRAATEILLNKPAVRNLIVSGRFNQIENTLQTSRAEGMHTMDMSLKSLLDEGAISEETLMAATDEG